MAKKKGICRNEECEMCDPSIIQEADEFNFVCEKCNQELFPVGGTGPDPDGKWKKWVIIGAAVAVLVGGGAFFAFSGGDEAPKKGANTSVSKPPVQKPDRVKTDNQKPATPTPDGGKGTSAQSTNPHPAGSLPPATSKPKSVKNGFGSVNLGYGKYEGDLKNGKPHGHGTITYTRSHQIVSSKDFVANPGDKFEGEFRDGRISGGIGYWYHDGDITAIQP